jgi:hypothetical protein
MVALVILGLGLLFIAAALPVGLEYTRQTIDMSTSDAAGEYATQQLDMALRTSVTLCDDPISLATSGTIYNRLDTIHRPRDLNPALTPPPITYTFRPTYEPIFKVRPFALGNISLSPLLGVDSPTFTRASEVVDDPEETIAAYLGAPNIGTTFRTAPTSWGTDASLEVDFQYNPTGGGSPLSQVYSPLLPGLARVYPPITPVLLNPGDSGFSVRDFFGTTTNVSYHPYMARKQNGTALSNLLYNEREKAIDQRIVWTAFYRRISYKGQPGPDALTNPPGWYNPTLAFASRSTDDVADAPLTYEIIYVIAQRPTTNHRFPRQDLRASGLTPFSNPTAVTTASGYTNGDLRGIDRLAPTPWLVIFTSPLPTLTPPADFVHVPPAPYVVGTPPGLGGPLFTDRYLAPKFNPTSTLTFTCTRQVGDLLPPGSVFIPALNDQCYNPTGGLWGAFQKVGFVPSAPEALPIYEIAERINDPSKPNITTLIVKNPGYYPWVNTASYPENYWPVWVIPPAFTQRDKAGQPVYENKSPIIKIIRRTVTIPEIKR